MSGQAEREACDEAVTTAELQEEQVEEAPQRSFVDVCVRAVTRAVARISPAGTRTASATTTTTITVPEAEQEEEYEETESEEEEEEEGAAPPPRPPRWVVGAGSGGGGVMATEPARGNMERAHLLKTIAGRVRDIVTDEGRELLQLKDEVASAARSRALPAVRVWLREQAFERRLHAHLRQIFFQMSQLHAARLGFVPDAVAAAAGGQTLRLLDDLASADRPSGGAAFTSGRHTPNARKREDSGTSSSSPAAMAAVGDEVVSEVEQAGAEPCGSSVGTGEQLVRRSLWVHRKSHRRLETTQTAGTSSSSSGTISRSDSVRDCATALQQPRGAAVDAAAVDYSLVAAVEESEAIAAMEVFRECQHEFQQLMDALRQHTLVADSVLRHMGIRRLPEAQKIEGQPQPHELLLHDIALMHSEMKLTAKLVSQTEMAMKRVTAALLDRQEAAPSAEPQASSTAAPAASITIARRRRRPRRPRLGRAFYSRFLPEAREAPTVPEDAAEDFPSAEPLASATALSPPRFGPAWFLRILNPEPADSDAPAAAPGAEPADSDAPAAAPGAEPADSDAPAAAPGAEPAELSPLCPPRFGRAWFPHILRRRSSPPE